MRAQDPFAPLSKKRKIGYTVCAALVTLIVAVLLGSMEGGFSAWQLLRVACLAGIPAFVVLAAAAWLSGGERTESGVGQANVKFPVRLLKAMPYLVGIIALFYLMKAIETFQSR